MHLPFEQSRTPDLPAHQAVTAGLPPGHSNTGRFSGNTQNAGNVNTSVGGGTVTIAGLVQTISGSTGVSNIQIFPQDTIPGPWQSVDTFSALNSTMAAQLSTRNTFWRNALNRIINDVNAHAHRLNLSGDAPTTTLNWLHSHTVDHNHGMAHDHNMQHRHDMQHIHDIRHVHDMRHRHNMDHIHRIEVPNHVHLMEPRMALWREQPTNFQIIINGVLRQTVNATHFNRDITDWLLDAQGRLLRGVYNRIEIRPNLPAHIRQMACVQGFVNSRGNRAL